MKTLRNLDLKSERNSYIVAVAIALLVASVLLGYYYVDLRPKSEGYMTLYLLNTQKDATEYPETLVNGVNSIFSVYVDVENHMGEPQDCTVYVKVVQDMNPTFPVYSVEPTLNFTELVADGAIWEESASIPLTQAGNYMVVFELWTTNEKEELQFTDIFTALNIQVL